MSAVEPKTTIKKSLVISGTSGSHDYLKDTTGDRRYWPVRVPVLPTASLSAEDRAVVDKLLEMTSGTWVVEPAANALIGPAMDDDEATCDGIHDDGAPPLYLCTRCFPDSRGDLDPHEDDDEGVVRQDLDEEME